VDNTDTNLNNEEEEEEEGANEPVAIVDIGSLYSNSDKYEENEQQINNNDSYYYCNPCGPGQALSSDYDRNEVRVPTLGTFTCKELYQIATTLSLNPICALVQSAANIPCGCERDDADSSLSLSPAIMGPADSAAPGGGSTVTGTKDYYYYTMLVVGLVTSTMMVASSSW